MGRAREWQRQRQTEISGRARENCLMHARLWLKRVALQCDACVLPLLVRINSCVLHTQSCSARVSCTSHACHALRIRRRQGASERPCCVLFGWALGQ